MNKVAKILVGLSVASVAVFGMTACSSTNDKAPIIDPIPAPTSIDLASYNGDTVKAKVGAAIILQVASGTEADWTGKSSDEKVAMFVQGINTPNVVAIPSITPLSEGKAEVTLDNAKTGEEKVVKVEVTKK